MKPCLLLQHASSGCVIDFSTQPGVPFQQEFIIHCYTEIKIDHGVSVLAIFRWYPTLLGLEWYNFELVKCPQSTGEACIAAKILAF